MRSLPLGSDEIDALGMAAWATHLGRPVSDPRSLRHALGAGSMAESIAATAKKRAAAAAVTVGDRTITHGELDSLAGRAAAGLAGMGVMAGSRVAMIAHVGIEEIATYLGILRVGATAVLVNPMLTTGEMTEIVTRGSALVLVGSGSVLESAVSSGIGELRAVGGLRSSDRKTVAKLLFEVSPTRLPAVAVDPDAVAILAFTSGSTGHPKPTPLTHRNLLASVRGVMAAWRWNESDHLVHSLPISHQHGLSGVHATLLAGSRVTLLTPFDPEHTLRIVEQGATVHFGVPLIHQRLLDGLGDRARSLGRLRLAVSGSGPLSPELAERYVREVGQSLLERYGTTESGLDVSNPYEGERVTGTVGLALPGVEVALVDEGGSLTEEGDTGEILLRGPHVFPGYLGFEEHQQPFLGEWFRTGDLGRRDPDSGYLSLVGRTKEVIITGGMNVYPREVEDVLRRHKGVTDAAVVGRPSNEWGEEVVAVVAPASVELEGLTRFIIDNLAPYKRPKRLIPVDAVPRNEVGKPQRDLILGLISLRGN